MKLCTKTQWSLNAKHVEFWQLKMVKHSDHRCYNLLLGRKDYRLGQRGDTLVLTESSLLKSSWSRFSRSGRTYAQRSYKYIYYVFAYAKPMTHVNDFIVFNTLVSFFLSSRYGQTSTSWRLLASGCGHSGSAECVTNGSRCIGVVLIKIEMNVSGSSRKGRDSLSPQLVEYLRYSLWRYITPELFRE